LAIASSKRLPPTRRESLTTMPPSAMTAISDVPPPMSMMRLPDGPADRDVGADRGGQRLLDEVRVLRAGLEGRVADGALLDAGDARRDADHHVRLERRTLATLLMT
jgi:hypothetical protein